MSLTPTADLNNEKHNSHWMPTLWEAISLKSYKVAQQLFKVFLQMSYQNINAWKLAHVCVLLCVAAAAEWMQVELRRSEGGCWQFSATQMQGLSNRLKALHQKGTCQSLSLTDSDKKHHFLALPLTYKHISIEKWMVCSFGDAHRTVLLLSVMIPSGQGQLGVSLIHRSLSVVQ